SDLWALPSTLKPKAIPLGGLGIMKRAGKLKGVYDHHYYSPTRGASKQEYVLPRDGVP
ncbi:31474_t:CDS:1, partial [Racocetra persica]